MTLSGSIDGLSLLPLLHGVGVIIDPRVITARCPGHVVRQSVGLPDGGVPEDGEMKRKKLNNCPYLGGRGGGVSSYTPGVLVTTLTTLCPRVPGV